MNTATVRSQLETVWDRKGLSRPFADPGQRGWAPAPSGIPELDTAIGGLPRGAITEIYGQESSGKTSLALSILAAAAARQECCAWIDGMDRFDPLSGAEAGVDLRRFVWVRCRNLAQVLRSTDLILQGGGFGVVAADLSDLPPSEVRGISLGAWFRLQRVIENTPAILLLLTRESTVRSAAALVLKTVAEHTHWSAPENRSNVPAHARLLSSRQVDMGVVRIRNANFQSLSHHVHFHSHS